MKFDTLTLEESERGVAMLVLNRPEKHNALNEQMIFELGAAAEAIAGNNAIRAVILSGSGESFCAGADLGWMRAQFDASRALRIDQARKLAETLRALNNLPVPLIGSVNGQAYGGGLGLISVCDTAIAVDSARFGFTEPRLGLVPATISPYCTARLGEARARRVFMSGRRFGAQEAVELGLIARSVAAEDLNAAVEEEVAPYLLCAPEAVAASKALVRQLGFEISNGTLEMTAEKLADCWETDAAQEGVGAFFEKRKPSWAK